MIKRLTILFLRILLGCIPVLLVATVACAQVTSAIPDLIVTVRDGAGAPLADLMVQLYAAADSPLISESRTDAQGQAMFAPITVSQLRVRVRGTLTSGAQLYQPGADAPGIAVLLGPPPTRLDLRVEHDGMVLPDPATMRDPLMDGPTIAPAATAAADGHSISPTSATEAAPAAPTATALATASLMTSIRPSTPAPAPVAAADAGHAASAAAHLRDGSGGRVVALVLVIGGLLGLFVCGRRQP